MAFKAQLLHFPSKASYLAERTRQENAGTREQFERYLSFVDEGPTIYTWWHEYNSIEDVLTSTRTDSALSANKGRELNEKIDIRNIAAVDSGNIIDTEVIPAVQPSITVDIKDNGNIVLGNLSGKSVEFMPATPSGDPLHYIYEECGAIWDGDAWSINDQNLSSEQIRIKYITGELQWALED